MSEKTSIDEKEKLLREAIGAHRSYTDAVSRINSSVIFLKNTPDRHPETEP